MSESHAREVSALVDAEEPRLRRLAAADTRASRAPGKWSRREVLGHLIDSACNNHQRFVRAQLAPTLEFPGYAQEDWVRCQAYAATDWTALVDLWCSLNRHITRVLQAMPREKLTVPCRIGSGPVTPLGEIIADYLRHVRHHLEQIWQDESSSS